MVASPDQEKALGVEWGDVAPIEMTKIEIVPHETVKRRGRPPKVIQEHV